LIGDPRQDIAGLAAMILYCARLAAVGDKEWQYLKSAKGMEAFGSINVTKNHWLPVHKELPF
jgi:hypothetical protein